MSIFPMDRNNKNNYDNEDELKEEQHRIGKV